MSPEQLFQIVNLIALVAWVLLALSPWIARVTIVTGRVIPIALAILYVAIVAANWGTSEGGFSSLPDVATLFSQKWILLAGWIHYLVFDLLVGHWEVSDARSRGIPHLIVVPCLALTFMFGPAGWLLYAVVRSLRSPVTT